MQISILLTLFSAAALTSATPTAEAEAWNSLETRGGPSWVLNCCNPKNNDKYHMKETGECCYNIGGSANYEFSNPSCGMERGGISPFKKCCNDKGRALGTPDWAACTP